MRSVWLLLAAGGMAMAGNGVTAGRFAVERPTLICLGFEWQISGDDNRNASVDVRYRKAGASAWREGMPLLRMGGERVFSRDVGLDYTVPDMFAGSIVDLEPATEYEAEFRLRDADGVSGDAVHLVKVRTRGEPKAAAGGRVLHVYPPAWRGAKQQPAFTGLMKAYAGAGGGDWGVVSERKVQPGDTILVHAGLYRADRLNYADPLSVAFDGTYMLTAKGTPERPIVIRGAGDGEAIFDGDGAQQLFNVMAADYTIFEGLTIRNTGVAFLAGLKDVAGSKGLTVRRCRIEDVGIAVQAQYAGSQDFYIADNVIIGRDDRYRLLGWYDPGIYGANRLKSYYAIKVYGEGHVVCHNYVAYFHDGIDVCTHGSPGGEGERAAAIDFYNNDIHLVADDFIETDGGVHNIRVMRNRGVNAGQCGLSAQPVFGGPAYFIRNVLYHVPWGFALKFKVKPAGMVMYHNTIIAESRNGDSYSNALFRNNLFLGTDAPNREIFRFPNATAYSSYDYDGYRRNAATKAQYLWKAPRNGAPRDYELDSAPYESFATLADLREKTGQEVHGIEVDYDIFGNLRPPDPAKPHAVYEGRELDFRLRPGGKAVDAGVRLPNVNDDFTGKAPDLGAYEVGAPPVVYGPRE